MVNQSSLSTHTKHDYGISTSNASPVIDRGIAGQPPSLPTGTQGKDSIPHDLTGNRRAPLPGRGERKPDRRPSSLISRNGLDRVQREVEAWIERHGPIPPV